MELELALEIVKELLAPKYLTVPQEMVFRAAWQGQSYRDLADSAGYDRDYIKGVGAQVWRMLATATERRVTKINFRQVIESLAPADLPPSTSDPVSLQQQIDWVETMLGTSGYTNDASPFYGREAECRQLYRWLVVDRCRLVTILGMGGMGKTTIAIELIRKLQAAANGGDKDVEADGGSGFGHIIWRSLLNAPLLKELLPELIRNLIGVSTARTLPTVTNPAIPHTVTAQIELLLALCQQHRCAIVLDNCESIFQGGAQVSLSGWLC